MAHYFPIIRTKAGEATALRHLSAAARAKITPVINLVGAPAPSYGNALGQAWAGQSAALDGTYNYGETGSLLAFNAMFAACGSAGVNLLPSVTINDPAAYIAAVQALVGTFAPGLVVQTPLSQIAAVAGWVSANGWAAQDIDLIVSAGEVSALDPASYASYVAHVMNPNIVQPSQWRSVTLHSYCAPKDHGPPLSVGPNLVRRLDWAVWQNVATAFGFPLNYSDCGHVHATLDEPPGAAMAAATVSVRYAIDDYWVIRKGVRTTGPNGQLMQTQYKAHAQALMALPQFNAVPGCWADGQIVTYAGSAAGSGGRSQWASIGMNRHLSLVADRLP